MDKLADQAVGALLAAIGSTAPAPGAGAAAGAVLAIGLACARKAIAMTLRHHPDAARLDDLNRRLAGLVEQALAGGDADAATFTALIDVPHGAAEAHRDTLEALAAVDENLVAIADEAQALVLGVRAAIHPSMSGDIAAALGLIATARSIHAACVAEARRALGS